MEHEKALVLGNLGIRGRPDDKRYLSSMRNILQPVLQHLYKRSITHVKSGGTFKQSFAFFGSDSPQYPPEPLECGEISESNVENDEHNLGMYGKNKDMKKIILKKQSFQGKQPLRMTLASTNKMLFGPLLETSQEKKRREKREARGIDEAEYAKKRKKKGKKREKEKPLVQPLILNSANSHYLSADNVFSSIERLPLSHVKDRDFILKEKLPLSEIDIEKNSIMSHNKKRIIVKPRFDVEEMGQESLGLLSKNYVESDRFPHYGKIVESDVSIYDEENVNVDNENAVSSMEIHHKPHSGVDREQTYHDLIDPSHNIYGNQYAKNSDKSDGPLSFISIDNSKFTAVPQTLNIGEMESFPLFSDIVTTKSIPERDHVEGGHKAISISMFEGGYQKLPSVRKILEETMPLPNKIALEKWKAKMIKELGEEGFNQYRQDLLNRGKFLHECVQSELSGARLGDEHTLTVKELWRSLKPVLPSVLDIQVLESRLIHPYLYYQGAVDCVASYRGMPVLIEWKTSSKPKLSLKSMFDDPLQVVAYLGALNFDSNYRLPQPIESAMLVVAYESGLPAHTHLLKKEDCSHYWKIWCSRLCQFWRQHKPEATNVA